MASNKDKSRQYTSVTIKRLHTLSGNECAEPSCKKKMIAEDGKTIVSKICHITAASANGPRYDASMTDDERRDFDNLILLCDEHHSIIDNKDNELEYPIELLKEWKNNHENKISELTASKNLLSKYPLALNKVINAMGKNVNNILDLSKVTNAPNPDVKISYNNVIRYKSIIRQHVVYQGKLNKIYEEIEKEGSVKKLLILNNIKTIYDTIVLEKDIEWIKKNSDKIFDQVIEETLIKIDEAPNKLEEFDQETLNFCLRIVMVDAFMRCNILEEPPKIESI